MAKEKKAIDRKALREAITARKEARKAERTAKYEKMRAAAKNPAQFEGILNSLIATADKTASQFEALKDNLNLHRAAANAPAKIRVAAARKFAKGFVKAAEETPDLLADALRQTYKGLDEQAAALEMAAEVLGIELGATPTEQAFADEGMAELEEGEAAGEAEAESPVDEKPSFEPEKKDEESEDKSEEKSEEEPKKEEESEESEEEDKPEEKEAASGSDAFVTDRDSSGQPEAAKKLEIPRAQGVSEINKGANDASKNAASPAPKQAMTKKDFILLADAIRESGLGEPMKEDFANHLSQYLRRSNPAFMQDRFVDYVMGRGGPSGGRVKQQPKAQAAPAL